MCYHIAETLCGYTDVKKRNMLFIHFFQLDVILFILSPVEKVSRNALEMLAELSHS